MGKPGAYFPATRHPWPCLLFVLPLLVAYEAGVLLLGGPHPETVRNGSATRWKPPGLRCRKSSCTRETRSGWGTRSCK